MALEQDVGRAVTAASRKRVVLQHDPSIVIVGTGFLSPGHAATSLDRVLLDGRPLGDGAHRLVIHRGDRVLPIVQRVCHPDGS
jgi:hypothetical protein